MSDTICGYRQNAVVLALHVARNHPSKTSFRQERRVLAPNVFGAGLCLYDPAKLAKMLAERGRELGFAEVCTDHTASWVALVVYPNTKTQAIEIYLPSETCPCADHPGRMVVLSMTQARALLAAWLALPDGDRDGAENALRSVT